LWSQARENIETSISERHVKFLGGLAHEVDHVSLDLWTVGIIGFPVVEPMLVCAFELFRPPRLAAMMASACASWSGKVIVKLKLAICAP